MSEYLGDFAQGSVVYIEKCTTDSTGLPSAMTSGSACVKRMSDQVLGPGCTAITTSGGLFSLSVTTGSSATFYVKGDYSVYLGAGTAGGVIIIGYPLGQFSIGRFASLTLSTNVLQWNGGAVSNAATGIPKVDVDTIKTNAVVNGGTLTFPSNATLPSTTTTLSANVIQWQAANVSSAAAGIPKVDLDTIKTNPVVNGGTITFPTTATLASTTNITAGTITTVTNLTNAPTAGDFTSTMKTSIQTAATAVTLSADVKSINGVSTSPVTTVKAVQGLTTADTITTTTNLTTNNDKTGYALTAAYDPAKTASQAGDAMTLTAAYDFAKGTVAMVESYAADTVTMTPVQALHMIWANDSQFAITTTSISVKKLDGTTQAMNFDLDSATTPTLRNRNV